MMTIKDHARSGRPARWGLMAALAVLAIGLSGCIDDDEPLAVVEPEPFDGPALFERYVALGNSITAGFQSGGLNVELQEDAYPVLLAEKADAPFAIPGIQYPGCPVPLATVLPPSLISDTQLEASECRLLPVDPEIQNLAVPGAAVADLSNPLWVGGGLHALLLGGRTQLGLLAENGASLVTAWIGNNDALYAGLTGEPALLTPLADFQAAYDVVVAAIAGSGATDAILLGVANPLIVPALQPGAFFWASAQPGSPIESLLDVDDSCAPTAAGGSRLVSFLTVSQQLAATGGPVVISCSADAPFVITDQEMVTIGTRVAQFNGYIEAQADANGWSYVDPANLLGPALGDPDLIRKCQGLATATTPEEFAQAVAATCPGPTAPGFFGSYFSLDGVHPSSTAHAVVADALAGLLNQKHGLDLPVQ